jgi:hypothetical protein
MDNIKIVRLQSGEDVIADYTQVEGDSSVLLTNPMCLIFKRMPTGRAVMLMSPWLPLELVEKNEAWLFEADILSIFQPKSQIIDYYTNTVKEVEEDMIASESEGGDYLRDISDEFGGEEMTDEEELQAMEELNELRQDVKKRLLH